MARPRLEGRPDQAQMDFLWWMVDKNGSNRNTELRAALDRDPEYQAMMKEVEEGTERGKRYLRQVAVIKRSLV